MMIANVRLVPLRCVGVYAYDMVRFSLFGAYDLAERPPKVASKTLSKTAESAVLSIDERSI